MRRTTAILVLGSSLVWASAANATLLTDPSDSRSWQGATVGTFAGLFGLTNQEVIDQELLDDGIFDTSTGVQATPTKCIVPERRCREAGGPRLP